MVKILYNNKIVKKQYTNGNVINKIPFQVEGGGQQASLPDVPFLVNYNARDYDATNYTLKKTAGQLRDVDAVCNYGYHIVDHSADGYITVTGDTRMVISGTPYLNRNNTQTGCTMTIVSKVKTTAGNESYSIITNRGGYTTMNWMWRYPQQGIFLHGSSSYNNPLYLTSTTGQPITASIRISYNGGVKQQLNDWTNNGSYSGNFQYGPNYNGDNAMFCDYTTENAEFWKGDFYWVYVSQNVLTDEQIQQVIAYNEGSPTPQKETIYWQYAEMGSPTPPEPIDYTKEYLTFEPISSAVTFSHGIQTFQYSLDDGETWSTCTTAQTVTVNVGQKMKLKGNFNNINQDRDTNRFTATGGTWKAYGNLLSLLYGDNFASVTVLDKDGLLFCFYHCKNLVNVDNLTIPITSITVIRGLRATFRDCGFSSVPSDLLPATTLANECYMGTFEECVNLVKAPTLPATSIPNYGYFAMFNNCESLNEVTCLATTNIGGNRTQLFLTGTASSGTFYKASSATWSTGQYGIPSGWTVQDAV